MARVLGYVVLALLALTLGAWIILVEIPARQLPAAVAELEARGETLDLAELAPPSIPDEDNAAVLLEEAFADLRRVTQAEEEAAEESVGEEPRRHPHWAAYAAWGRANDLESELEAYREHKDDMRGFLSSRAPVLRLVDEALKRSACRYTRHHDYLVSKESLERNGGLREVARLLYFRSWILATEGDTAGAIADCGRLIDLTQTLSGEPTLIDYLVQGAVLPMAVDRAQDILARTDPPQESLHELGAKFADASEAADLAEVLRVERALLFNYFQWMVPLELVKPDRPAEERERIRASNERILSWYVTRRYIAAGRWHAITKINELIDASALPYQAARANTLDALDDLPEDWDLPIAPPKTRVLSGLDSYRHLPAIHASRIAQLRTAAAGCFLAAKSRTGSTVNAAIDALPPDLRLDPFNEEPFLIARRTDALVVYSVGPNLHDDGGVQERRNIDVVRAVPDDIAFGIPLS